MRGGSRRRLGTRIGYLSSRTRRAASATPFETVLAAAEERDALAGEAEQQSIRTVLPKSTNGSTRSMPMGRRHEPRASLRGLASPRGAKHRPLDEFSGGWRMRVALGALLFSEPDLLAA